MEGLKTDDLANLLGLFHPWTIKKIQLNETAKKLVIEIGKQTDKSLFAFMHNKHSANLMSKRWQHIKLGQYSSYIEVNLPAAELAELASTLPPAFLGAPGKLITREISESIRIGYANHLDSKIIADFLGLDIEITDTEIKDIKAKAQKKNSLALLPLESNDIWKDILTEQRPFSTQMLPLKLLLSRLKLEITKDPGTSTLQKSIMELRAFFIRHSAQLKSEYQQLGAYEIPPTDKKTQSTRLKLLLPGSQSIIWQQLLTGELKLKSKSMPLQLCLAQQQRTYQTSSNDQQRDEAIRTLQLFFKHNAKNLIAELKFLADLKAKELNTKHPAELPAIDNCIWKNILLDDQLLESSKMNYRLLVSKLKTTYQQTGDDSCLFQLREFFNQNARSMEEEIQTINRLASSQ